ncbi:acyl-CoA dehydrogenase family protein [Sulfitobacter porphyrae]|uniref:Acyl-CoA dehydrogenase family protein n=1 Tax=Sulfitobacter porphyrae TaxID=1246864 RepID=A0ABW2BAY0_9RHOB
MTRQDTITAATGPFNEDLNMIRDQLRRFIETEVTAKAEPWEEEGMVPRDVLRRMGDLGVLGMRYDKQYGGAGLDVVSSVVLAEEVGRSTFGGFSATVLVHTDMASPHLEMRARRNRRRAGCHRSYRAKRSPPWP